MAAAPLAADPLAALPPRSGYRRRTVRVPLRAADRLLDLRRRVTGLDRRLAAAAAEGAPAEVAVLGVYGPRQTGAMAAIVAELRRSRHRLHLVLGALGPAAPDLADATELADLEGGRLANLNRLVASAGLGTAEWVLVIDDDIALPAGFLDNLLALARRFRLDLVQPALTLASHTAFGVTRRRPLALRRTRFVEQGPALLVRRPVFEALAPFPEQGMGWGICLTWAAMAERRGWRLGVADAVAVRHEGRPPGTGYDRDAAFAAARELLAEREHLGWREAEQVLERHRSIPAAEAA